LAKQDDFCHTALEQLMQQFLQSRNRKIAEIIHALRVAVTGKSVGLGMFETLEILGKKRTLRRLERVVAETSFLRHR
jgi:glutamyl-tRNA synthetase